MNDARDERLADLGLGRTDLTQTAANRVAGQARASRHLSPRYPLAEIDPPGLG
ncbi:hypothetical protein PSP31121_05396 [Pandoraea sputorum]|uniref:Uncharacterized protein n=1 Tax=Pandoraea sputorum TaxID=93222 RepID=A0A5E5BK60_9BURK|nr:hypothetical protein PSP31121_05396 [Pandoraea sputorum]